MKKIGIIIVAGTDHIRQKYMLEHLSRSTTHPFCQAYISIMMPEHISKAAIYLYNGCKVLPTYTRSISGRYNELIDKAKKDSCTHICIVPFSFMLSKGWLQELSDQHQKTSGAGIFGIINDGIVANYIPVMQDDNSLPEPRMIHLLQNDLNSVVGVQYFSVSSLDFVGYFDDKADLSAYEQAEFCFRFSANGYTNCYIRKHHAIVYQWVDHAIFPIQTKEREMRLIGEIQRMSKCKNFKK